MPKSKTHWGYDLLTVVLVGLVSAFVFWAVPAQAGAGTTEMAMSVRTDA